MFHDIGISWVLKAVELGNMYDKKNLPFYEVVKKEKRIRTFSENVKSHELKWHFDNEDRNVKVIESKNWLLQIDNELPESLIEGKEYFIPKGKYHRIIKGDGNLKVEITFKWTI